MKKFRPGIEHQVEKLALMGKLHESSGEGALSSGLCKRGVRGRMLMINPALYFCAGGGLLIY